MSAPHRLSDLARHVGGRVVGDPQRQVRGVATLESAGADDLAFLTHPRYRKAAQGSPAAVLVGPGVELPGHDLIEVPNPQLALAEILEIFHPPRSSCPGVSPDARLGPGVELKDAVEIGPFAVLGRGVVVGSRCVIGPGCILGDEVEVGPDTILMPRVVLYPGTRVGARCLLHSGVVLGADGFGFAASGGRHRKIPQVGRVILGDDVEIGANSTVDRGAIGNTEIGRGTKIDDLVMVAHGVQVGEDCLLVAQSGIAGSARLGARVTVAGQSGVAGHLSIGDAVVIAAKSAVFSDLPPGAFVAGIPAVDHGTWKRSVTYLKKIEDLRRSIRSLESRLRALEEPRGEAEP